MVTYGRSVPSGRREEIRNSSASPMVVRSSSVQEAMAVPPAQRIRMPEIARAMTSLWISLVPSKMV